MSIRRYIDLVEGASALLLGLDREAIVKKIVDAYAEGAYWDDTAVARYPDREFGSDDPHEMHDTWRDDEDYELADVDDSSEAITRPEFRVALERWARARLEDVEAKLAEVPLHDGFYRIHRVMRVPARWWAKVKKQGQTNLGVHWTYDLAEWNAEIGARPVWAPDDMKGADITIEALVKPEDVDWPYTVMSHMDWYSGDREYEMRVLPGRKVEVIAITDENGGHYDIAGVDFVA